MKNPSQDNEPVLESRSSGGGPAPDPWVPLLCVAGAVALAAVLAYWLVRQPQPWLYALFLFPLLFLLIALLKQRRETKLQAELAGERRQLQLAQQQVDEQVRKQVIEKQLRLHETRAMELMARNAPLLEVMQEVVSIYSVRDPEAMCSVYLIDPADARLHLICALKLPESWLRRTATIRVDAQVGICGAAAARAEAVVVPDVRREPNCAELLEHALEAGIRAGWGTPIFSSQREVLGSFAIYYPYVKDASEEDLWMLDRLGHIAGVAIEKHRAEQALAETEEKYRAIFNFKAWAILLVDPHSGLITDANPTAAELYGYSLKEIQGVPLQELAPAANNLQQKVRELHSKQVSTSRLVHRSRGGAYFPVEETAMLVRLGGKEFLNLVVRDRTETEEAERKQEEKEKKYELLFNTQRDGHVLADVFTGKIIDCNQAAAAMHGYSIEELMGMPSVDLSVDRDFVMKLRQYTEQVKDYPFHLPLLRNVHKRKDGSEFPTEISITLTKIGGKVIRSLVVRDISLQVEAERELKTSEQRFRDFAEVAADWFWELDTQFNVTYLSKLYSENDGEREGLHGDRGGDFEKAIKNHEALRAHLDDPARRLQPFDGYEYVWQQQDLGKRTHRLSGKAILDANGELSGYRGVSRDVTDALRLTQQLTYQASHDSLTGLVNRREFELRLERVIESALKQDTSNALCYLDLDQFKVINDTCGHAAGDQLLCQLADWIKSRVRSRDTLARLGGDEFGIIMEHCELEDARRIVQNLLDSISDFQFRWQDKNFRVGMSIGLVPINKFSRSQGHLMSLADSACFAAKDEGRNRVYVTQGELDEALAQRSSEMHWVARIDAALDRQDQFQLLVQPILDIAKPHAKWTHFEVLIRMLGEHGESIPPGAFLPAAERYNRANRLDRWVVEHCCQWFAEHPRVLGEIEKCAINLSGHSLSDPTFLDFVINKLKQYELPASKICFEVTETVAIANLTEATRFMRSLRELGCSFALDDFGSGLSSFAYLKNLPVDYLKIDGVFVKDIVHDPIDRAMVKSINDIAHVMGKKTIAEFVENQEILDLLAELGVDYAQGYRISAPMPLAEIARTTSPLAAIADVRESPKVESVRRSLRKLKTP